MTHDDPLLLTVKQAADKLAYKERKIYDMLATGEIRGVGTVRGRRIPVSELERWVKEQIDGQAADQFGGNSIRIS